MQTKINSILFVGLIAALSFSYIPRATATSISGTLSLANCGGSNPGCPAAMYTFTIGPDSADDPAGMVDATLIIKITGAVSSINANNDEITGVDLGFTPSKNISSISLEDHPSGTWTAFVGSLNNGNCGTDDNGAFVCATGNIPVILASGGMYTWTWDVGLKDSSKIFSVGDVHIGANYGPDTGLIVSETGGTSSMPSVPEPATLSLFGVGLLGIAARLCRKPISNRC